MKNKNIFNAFVIVMTVMALVFAMSFTVFATEAPVEEVPSEDYVQPQEYPSENYVDDAEDNYDEPVYEEPSEEVYEEPSQEEYDDSYENYVENTQPSSEDSYEGKLPQVSSENVTEPTTMKIPDIEVSDTSLIGGVIAWLCVAVGIAVIAGVLVSQRTRQSSGVRR